MFILTSELAFKECKKGMKKIFCINKYSDRFQSAAFWLCLGDPCGLFPRPVLLTPGESSSHLLSSCLNL